MSKDTTIRINKRIKDLGLASRREADTFLEKGFVLVNGKAAVLGQQVSEADVIEIKKINRNYKYYLFNKPKGVVSHSPQYEEKEVKDFFTNFEKDGLTIVGRLDKHSEGLMLITNDKRLVERILKPEYAHERQYMVDVQEKISNNMVRLFEKGFTVKDRFFAKPAIVEILSPFSFSITLTEGKKHQIRLMANELHYTVSRLQRVRIMNLKLGVMREGTKRDLTQSEKTKLLSNIGLREI